MKLDSVHVYVSVEFGPRRARYNYFSDRNELSGLSMEFLKDYQCVSIKKDEHTILIPIANVAVMVPLEKGKPKSANRSDSKLGEVELEASHPKFKRG
jgi:hypothetical protein